MAKKSVSRDLFHISQALLIFPIIVLLREAHRRGSVDSGLILTVLCLCGIGMLGVWLLGGRAGKKPVSKKKPRNLYTAKVFDEHDAADKRTPYNAHGADTDKPVWRHIPSHATLLLDTNVLMCPDAAIRSWFGYLLHHAKVRDWRIVVHGAVYEEIIRHLKHGSENKAKDARLARNRIELMTDKLDRNIEIYGLNADAVNPTDSHYADPLLIEYMCTHKRTFLFTFDNDLKIRCKHMIRSKQPKNLVFSEEDFYA